MKSDDALLAAVHELRQAVLTLATSVAETSASIVGTKEACRRLHIGPDQLSDWVAEGRIARIPHMRGIGAGFCYHVDEISRCAEEMRAGRHLRQAVAS